MPRTVGRWTDKQPTRGREAERQAPEDEQDLRAAGEHDGQDDAGGHAAGTLATLRDRAVDTPTLVRAHAQRVDQRLLHANHNPLVQQGIPVRRGENSATRRSTAVTALTV